MISLNLFLPRSLKTVLSRHVYRQRQLQRLMTQQEQATRLPILLSLQVIETKR